jgi:hypothetical protein
MGMGDYISENAEQDYALMEHNAKKAYLRENPEQFQKDLINYYVKEVIKIVCDFVFEYHESPIYIYIYIYINLNMLIHVWLVFVTDFVYSHVSHLEKHAAERCRGDRDKASQIRRRDQ